MVKREPYVCANCARTFSTLHALSAHFLKRRASTPIAYCIDPALLFHADGSRAWELNEHGEWKRAT